MNFEVARGKTTSYHLDEKDSNTLIFEFDIKSFNKIIYILEQMMIAGVSTNLISNELEKLVNNPTEYCKQNPDFISKKFAKRIDLQNIARLKLISQH